MENIIVLKNQNQLSKARATAKDLQSQGMPIQLSNAKIHCRLYEDNSGALEIMRKAKYRPRTRHLLV
jgi:hypothetical protein